MCLVCMDVTKLEMFANTAGLRSLLADGTIMPMINVYQRGERRAAYQ